MEHLNAGRISDLLSAPDTPVYVYETLDSTSDECRRRLAAGEQRCLVLAESQTGGRGRSGKSFFSPPGGLYMSLAMPAAPELTGLTCLAAVAAAEAVEKHTGLYCGIKWVNDLYFQGKKVCGILAEAVGESVILGVGIDLAPAALPAALEGVVGFLDRAGAREPLAAEIAGALLRRTPDRRCMEAYRRRSIVLGRELRCRVGDRAFTARAVDIDPDGALVVEGPAGRERLFCGEILPAGGTDWR